jgi:hypothetical protein
MPTRTPKKEVKKERVNGIHVDWLSIENVCAP